MSQNLDLKLEKIEIDILSDNILIKKVENVNETIIHIYYKHKINNEKIMKIKVPKIYRLIL